MDLEDILLIVISGVSIVVGITGFVWGMRKDRKCRELTRENEKLLVRNLELEYELKNCMTPPGNDKS